MTPTKPDMPNNLNRYEDPYDDDYFCEHCNILSHGCDVEEDPETGECRFYCPCCGNSVITDWVKICETTSKKEKERREDNATD